MSAVTNFLLLPVGSHGDVHPFIGLGRELKRRGHEVTVFVNGHFRDLVERAALAFVEVGTAEEFHAALEHPDLWKPGPASMRVMAQLIAPLARRQYELILEHHQPGRTVVVAGALAFGARIAQEKHEVPTAGVQLAPASFRSVHEPSAYAGAPRALLLAPWMPPWLKRAQWRFIDFVIDRYFTPGLNALRRELDLPPVRRVFERWWLSPRLTVGLFPDWYAPPQPDWPDCVKLTGFPLYDEADIRDLPRQAEEFFSADTPDRQPIVFTPGSANAQAKVFFEVGIETARMLGRPAALLTRHPDQLPRTLPPGCRYFCFLPLSTILPRSAAIVHHGGIGTTAQALRAGCPQVIMPMAYDQLDNAQRVRRLGVGAYFMPKRFQPCGLAGVIRRLIADPGVKDRCHQITARFKDTDAIAQTCDLLESLTRFR